LGDLAADISRPLEITPGVPRTVSGTFFVTDVWFRWFRRRHVSGFINNTDLFEKCFGRRKRTHLSGWVLVCLPEVMRDFRASAALAVESGADKELQREIEEWMETASGFWRGKTAQTLEDKAAKSKAKPKLFRVGARDWLAAATCMLKVTADKSILDYVVTAEMQKAVPPSRWPALTVCIDQGSDGMAAVSYLMYRLNCNIMVLPDPSHRVWNDCQLALKAAKLWGLTMVMSKVFSLDHGPWADAKWYEQSKEAADVYLATTGCHSCPLFQELLGRILSDTGDASRIAEDGIELETWRSIPDAFQQKMQKVSMSRWFGWVDSAQSMLQVWHRRLLVYLYISMAEGWVQHSAASDFIKVVKVSKQPAECEQVEDALPTARDLPELQKLRLQCKNSLQLTTTMLMDPDLRQLVHAIVLALGPFKAWHSRQLKALKSVGGSARFYMEEAHGASMDSLRAVAGKMADVGFWQELGLWAPGDAKPFADEGASHPVVLSNDAVADQVGSLILPLLRHRSRSMLMHTRGLPHCFAGLLDVSGSGKTLLWMQKLDECWNGGVAEAKGIFWTRLRGRSSMQLVVTKQA